jgi:hypothetical protein
MPSDFESGTRKTIALTVQTEKLTSDILKTAIQEFLSGRTEKKGKMSFRQLEKQSKSKLDSIEVTENNIADFMKTARKYEVDFAIKRDKSASPPKYHVFFSADKTENFKKAFTEYASRIAEKSPKRGEISHEQLKEEAVRVSGLPRKKHKEREKKREQMI